MKKIIFLFVISFSLLSCTKQQIASEHTNNDQPLLFAGEERHLKNIRQLTFGGQNAEAYFSRDGKWLIFQSERDGYPCDQMYIMRIDGSGLRKVSTGKGRTTCGYFFWNTKTTPTQILYSSTHDFSEKCPQKPDYSKGYVWAVYPSYEIYTDSIQGGHLKRLTKNMAYDAESTLSPDGKEVVFTSTRDGDLDLYIMDTEGKHVRRVTKTLGYDGGAYFTHDGKRLVYRAYHPETAKDKKEYISLLKQFKYKPTWLEIFMIDKDGKNERQITNFHAASFAPYMFPDDKRVIFASNKDGAGNPLAFDLYAIDIDGKNLERITYNPTFDSFPMFSPDGSKLVWASNRNAKKPHETNIFIADWID